MGDSMQVQAGSASDVGPVGGEPGTGSPRAEAAEKP